MLDELQREVFLPTRRIDDIQAVTKGAGTLPNANAVNKQREGACSGIEGAQHVQHIVPRASRGVTVRGLRKIAQDRVNNTVERVGAKTQRRGIAWLYQATRPQQTSVTGAHTPWFNSPAGSRQTSARAIILRALSGCMRKLIGPRA